MPGRELEDIARPDLEFRPIGHLDSEPAAQRDADMMELAKRGASDWLDVLRPAPARLVRHPADHPISSRSTISTRPFGPFRTSSGLLKRLPRKRAIGRLRPMPGTPYATPRSK